MQHDASAAESLQVVDRHRNELRRDSLFPVAGWTPTEVSELCLQRGRIWHHVKLAGYRCRGKVA
jgi:hypothetical protein